VPGCRLRCRHRCRQPTAGLGLALLPRYSGSLVCIDGYFAMIRISFDRFVDPPAASAVKPGTQEHTTGDLKAVSGQGVNWGLAMVAVGRYNGPMCAPISRTAPSARQEAEWPLEGLMAWAGVLVADTGGVLVPCRFVERSAGSQAGFSHLITACEPVEAG
jgi:hypothetical protein